MKCLVKEFVFCQEQQKFIPLDKCEKCSCYKHLVRENNQIAVECDDEDNKNKK